MDTLTYSAMDGDDHDHYLDYNHYDRDEQHVINQDDNEDDLDMVYCQNNGNDNEDDGLRKQTN